MNRHLVTIVFILFSALACAMGSKQPKIERKDADKMWRACQDFEVVTGSAIGKLCNRTCMHKNSGKCSHWKQNVRDFNDPEDFNFFRDSSFIFINESHL